MMKSKEEIQDAILDVIDNHRLSQEYGTIDETVCSDVLATYTIEHSQSLAKEAVEGLEGIEHVNGREYNKAINAAIELIKAKFNI
jgi:hypothetical protein